MCIPGLVSTHAAYYALGNPFIDTELYPELAVEEASGGAGGAVRSLLEDLPSATRGEIEAFLASAPEAYRNEFVPKALKTLIGMGERIEMSTDRLRVDLDRSVCGDVRLKADGIGHEIYQDSTTQVFGKFLACYRGESSDPIAFPYEKSGELFRWIQDTMNKTPKGSLRLPSSLTGMADGFRWAIASSWGTYHHMQDEDLACALDLGDEQLAIFAVFDGHGREGLMASSLAKDKIQASLQMCLLNLKTRCKSVKLAEISRDYTLELINAFTLAILLTDIALIRTLPGIGGTTMVLSCKIGEDVYCFNVGDSRAVLFGLEEGDEAQISVDADPANGLYHRGLVARGAELWSADFAGAGYVSALFSLIKIHPTQLSVARALGDGNSKGFARADALCGSGVTARPMVHRIRAESKADKKRFLVQACDGVFDILTSAQVIDLCRALIKKGIPLQQIPRMVLETVCLLSPPLSGVDNLTFQIVDLQPAGAAAGGAGVS